MKEDTGKRADSRGWYAVGSQVCSLQARHGNQWHPRVQNRVIVLANRNACLLEGVGQRGGSSGGAGVCTTHIRAQAHHRHSLSRIFGDLNERGGDKGDAILN
jgi:hypothetical protein